MGRTQVYGGKEADEFRDSAAALADWSADARIAEGEEQDQLDRLMARCVTCLGNGKDAKDEATSALEAYKARLARQGFAADVLRRMERSAYRPGSALANAMSRL